MNCENFAEKLPEYVDQVLPEAEQAEARCHVQQCKDCQSVLAKHEAFAKSMRRALERETQGLSLRSETRQRILDACQLQEHKPPIWRTVQMFIGMLRRYPIGVAVCLLLAVFGSRLHRNSVCVCVIDVPIQTEIHVYHAGTNAVTDSVVPAVAIIKASLLEN